MRSPRRSPQNPHVLMPRTRSGPTRATETSSDSSVQCETYEPPTSGARTMDNCLVDTDILSEYLRGKNSEVQDRAREYREEHGRLTISVVTVFEVVRGRHQANQSEMLRKRTGGDRG
jgi:hypothetical protein